MIKPTCISKRFRLWDFLLLRLHPWHTLLTQTHCLSKPGSCFLSVYLHSRIQISCHLRLIITPVYLIHRASLCVYGNLYLVLSFLPHPIVPLSFSRSNNYTQLQSLVSHNISNPKPHLTSPRRPTSTSTSTSTFISDVHLAIEIHLPPLLACSTCSAREGIPQPFSPLPLLAFHYSRPLIRKSYPSASPNVPRYYMA